MKEYYARRAAEYDATSWEAFDEAERETVERFVASLPPGRTLDIGCGTGFLTRHLRGSVVGVDQSADVLELARARLPDTELVCADVPPLPFGDGAFDLAFSSNLYSHLDTASLHARSSSPRRCGWPDCSSSSSNPGGPAGSERRGSCAGCSTVRSTASSSATSQPTRWRGSWRPSSCSLRLSSQPCELRSNASVNPSMALRA
jgi:hypothetical protein